MPRAKPKRSRPKPGDVYEFDIDDGCVAYLQYLMEDDKSPGSNGSLVRVFPGTHAKPIADFHTQLPEREQFLIFFPVYGGLGSGAVRHVGHVDVPERLRTMPMFKDVNIDLLTDARTWFLVKRTPPTSEAMIGKQLHRAYLDYPFAMMAGIEAIKTKLLEGWTHRTWVREEDLTD